MIRVGVISDTHGLLRREALEALEGSDLIVHAGDVGSQDILDELGKIAPVHAVRGNTDGGSFGRGLPHTELLEVEGAHLYVIHIVEDLDLDPGAAGVAAVIYGHTHRPALERKDGVLWLNPGSAGQRRFDLPASVARVTVEKATVRAELVSLSQSSP